MCVYQCVPVRDLADDDEAEVLVMQPGPPKGPVRGETPTPDGDGGCACLRGVISVLRNDRRGVESAAVGETHSFLLAGRRGACERWWWRVALVASVVEAARGTDENHGASGDG